MPSLLCSVARFYLNVLSLGQSGRMLFANIEDKADCIRICQDRISKCNNERISLSFGGCGCTGIRFGLEKNVRIDESDVTLP